MASAPSDEGWNHDDEELLPWPISDSEDDSSRSGPWAGVLAIVIALAAAVAIIWGTIDYFVG